MPAPVLQARQLAAHPHVLRATCILVDLVRDLLAADTALAVAAPCCKCWSGPNAMCVHTRAHVIQHAAHTRPHAPRMSSEDPRRTVMRGSALSMSRVWLKHCSAVGSRMKFMTNWYSTKMRACSGAVRTGERAARSLMLHGQHQAAVRLSQWRGRKRAVRAQASPQTRLR